MRGAERRKDIKVPADILLRYALADVKMTMALWKH